MASTITPNHAAQMRETRLDVISGLEKPGAVGLRYCDCGFDIERIDEFGSLVEALDAMREAQGSTAALMAILFPRWMAA